MVKGKRSRAWVRAQAERKKNNVKRTSYHLRPIYFGDGAPHWLPSPRDVGIIATTPKQCSCDLCTFDWEDKRHRHRREKRRIINEQLTDV